MNLTEWSVKNIRPILFLTIALALAGALIYRTFPVAILPDVTFPRVVVIAEAGDRPTGLIEVSVTRPIEEALGTIPGVHRIRSKSKQGSTEISVDFNAGTDIVLAEQLVNARVNQVRPQLPPETATEVERMNPTVFPVIGLTVTSKSLTQTELWSLATYTIKPRLARTEGVARVVVQGGAPPSYEVSLRPEALAAAGISAAEVVQVISASNQIRAVGRLDHQFLQYIVTVDGQLRSTRDIGELVVATREGQPVRVRQLADVRSSVEDKTTVVSANGSESILINLIRQPTANSLSMVEGIKSEVVRLRHELPSDVRIETFYDQSVLIREAVGSVQEAVLIGALLSVVILMLFLRDLRATLVTAAIIPATVLITFLLMRAAGMTLNLMTLGALAVGIGLVIDDAIVVVEAVFQNLRQNESLAGALKRASGQIAAPMISSTLTTVVVFLPLALLQGVAGAFFSALAITLSLALMVSLGLALCVSPSMCAAFLRDRESLHQEGRLFESLLRGYRKLLAGILKFKWTIWPVIGATIGATVFLAGQLSSGFMPSVDEGAFVLDFLTPTGTSLKESDRLLQKVDKILLDTPEVATFSRRLGTELGFAITEPNRGDYAVMLKPGSRRNIEEVMGDIRTRVLTEVPGLDVEFIQVLQDLIGDLAGTPNPIEVKLFGENKPEVEAVATRLAGRLGKIKGLVDVKSGVTEAGPEMQIKIDPILAGRRGMTTESVAQQAEVAMLGTVATQVLQGDRQIPVRVRLNAKARGRIDLIENIGIQTPMGRVRLKDLGGISLIPGATQSEREDQRRVVSVSASLEGIDLGSAVGSVKTAVRSESLPPGVTAVVAGQFQSQQESFQNLTLVLGLAVLLVFVVMLFQFRSFGPPLVILSLMPMSLFGAVVALYVTHTALNVSSFMGVILLAGIVVKNGILLLDHAQQAVEAGMDPQAAILDAGQHRLRPILMTTMTAILGLLPLALGLGAGAEMQKPLAVAVVGGLAFSTLLTLVVGPVLYAIAVGRRQIAK